MLAGFFGESGSGKTSIINGLPNDINGKSIYREIGTIRRLFSQSSYVSPFSLEKTASKNEFDKYIESFMNSQYRLLCGFCSEIKKQINNGYEITLSDRTPIDFHTITRCGIEYLSNVFNYDISHGIFTLLEMSRQKAVYETIINYDYIFSVKSWNISNQKSINLNDGVRDNYLHELFTGNNWSNKLFDVGLTSKNIVEITDTDLSTRVTQVMEILK